MSISLSIGAVLDAELVPDLAGAAALEVLAIGGASYLYVAGAAEGALVALSIDGGMTLVTSVPTVTGGGGLGLGGLVAVDGPDGPAVLTLGRYDRGLGCYLPDTDGAPGTVTVLGDGSAAYQRAFAGVSYQAGGAAYVAIAPFGMPDLQVLRLDPGPAAVPVMRLTDTPALPLGDVTALAQDVLHGMAFLFAASGFDAGILAARIGADGGLSVTDVHLPDEASGFSQVSALGSTQIGPRAFVLFTATGTDSLHVLRLSAGGRMKEVDVFYDIGETRIANAQALEVIETATRTLVAVGGGDDGVSLFELGWTGRLVHLATVADDFPTTLDNLGDLAAVVDGDTVRLFAASPSDGGVTELILDTARSGAVLIGGPAAETLTGGAGDDEIWGRGRSDTLIGGAGDDRLIDGRGRDVLTGGPGADVFVFVADGRSDFITDFEPGVDRIDLSDFPGLYHISGLEIGTRADGAAIFVGADIIRVATAEGGPLDADLFTQDDFIFG